MCSTWLGPQVLSEGSTNAKVNPGFESKPSSSENRSLRALHVLSSQQASGQQEGSAQPASIGAWVTNVVTWFPSDQA